MSEKVSLVLYNHLTVYMHGIFFLKEGLGFLRLSALMNCLHVYFVGKNASGQMVSTCLVYFFVSIYDRHKEIKEMSNLFEII